MVKTINVEKFITAYKKLEQALRSSEREDKLVQTLEMELEESESQKLRLCRYVRNYIQHNNGDFVEPSQEMTDFVSGMVKRIESEGTLVKDMMVCTSPAKETDIILDVAKRLPRPAEIPVMDKNGTCVGLFTDRTARIALASGVADKQVKEVMNRLEKVPQTVKRTDQYKRVGKLAIVTDSGKARGMYLGTVRGV